MKNPTNHSTIKIFQTFPRVKELFESDRTEAMEKLDTVELVFWDLARFTSEPHLNSFDIHSVYNHLDAEHIALILDILHVFFEKDTYLSKPIPAMVIREDDPFVNQTGFAQIIQEQDESYTVSKVHVYYKRGNLPEPELTIEGKPYWKTSTVLQFRSRLQ